MHNRSMNGCSPMVAMVLPFNTAVPIVNGTVTMRPATGA
jgi:hypothetical protein